MEKVRAGHQVILLDPHAANHEWKGHRHIGAGMDYQAIAEFCSGISTKSSAATRSSTARVYREDWQQSLRQQQRITSVVSEEMTNWATDCPVTSAVSSSSPR
jgi:hypothetical protein